jgi:HK97 family phage prohead protease
MRETRVLTLPGSELRLEDGSANNPPKIIGYAAVFQLLSEPLAGGLFRERINPQAFEATLRRNDDVRALINHQEDKVLGRTKSGTLRLSTDAKGLKAEILPPDTHAARDLLESIRRGDIDGMSFGFQTIRDVWSENPIDAQPVLVRELLEVKLFDVSPVTFPAYPQTELAVRSLQRYQMQRSHDKLRRRLTILEKTV